MQSNSELLRRILQPTKRKVFISYHHADQDWVDYFREVFGATYELFTDCSLDKAIDSTNLGYVHNTIRDEYITGTSITIVLCGAQTHNRKCVDWEIMSTLNKDHALLGIALPTAVRSINGSIIVSNRLHHNIKTGYAIFAQWPQNPATLKSLIENAIFASQTYSKNNSHPKMERNL